MTRTSPAYLGICLLVLLVVLYSCSPRDQKQETTVPTKPALADEHKPAELEEEDGPVELATAADGGASSLIPTAEEIAGSTKITLATGSDDVTRFNKPDGPYYYLQAFGFNPDEKLAGPASGGASISIGDVPVPMLMSPSMGTFSLSGSVSAIYANTVWDLSNYANLSFGTLDSTSGGSIGWLELRPGSYSQIHISSDYVVSPVGIENVDTGAPFVSLRWNWAETAITPGSNLHLTRNGVELKSYPIDSSKALEINIGDVQTRNDVLEWKVEDPSGAVTHSGAVGFPVVSVVGDLVWYNMKLS